MPAAEDRRTKRRCRAPGVGRSCPWPMIPVSALEPDTGTGSSVAERLYVSAPGSERQLDLLASLHCDPTRERHLLIREDLVDRLTERLQREGEQVAFGVYGHCVHSVGV